MYPRNESGRFDCGELHEDVERNESQEVVSTGVWAARSARRLRVGGASVRVMLRGNGCKAHGGSPPRCGGGCGTWAESKTSMMRMVAPQSGHTSATMRIIVGVRFHTRSAAPLDVPEELVESLYAANHELSKLMMSGENHARFRLEAGDAVLFDNHRVMHSREGFDDPNRMMRICNVSREQFHEQLRLLAAKLGCLDQASQVLSAGVTG